MKRTGTGSYRTERAFLSELLARVENEMSKRAEALSHAAPELAADAAVCLETPIEQWKQPVNLEFLMQFGALKLEEMVIADMMKAIETTPLVTAIEGRIAGIERHELDLIRHEPVGRYLRDHGYWRDEDALGALNRLFMNWARWARGERLEAP